MTKKEFTDAVIDALPDGGNESAPITKNTRGVRMQAEAVMDALWGVMAAELLGGGEITLPKIGKLKVVGKKGWVGRHPKTHEPMDIPAGRRVTVKLFKEFKEALQP